MAPASEGDPPATDPMEEIREVVPARAVLTELARGFLLVQASDRERAVEFASTFLREYAGTRAPARPTATRPVVLPRRRGPEPGPGPVEPGGVPSSR
jgi:hypothetical protein